MGRFFTIFLLVAGGMVASLEMAQAQPSKASSALDSTNPVDFELLRTRYRFENDGTGRKEVIASIRILTDRGTRQQAEQTFEYHPLSEKLEIPYVRVRKNDGTIANIETNIIQSVPADVTPDSDLDERRVRIPNLAVGDLVEYDVVTVIHRALGPREFCVQHHFQPSEVSDEQLEVDVPMERQVKLKSMPNVKFWQTVKGARRVYHWEKQNPEANRLATVPYVPGRTPDVQLSSFQSWDEVGRWYSNLEKSHRIPTPEIKAKADELTKESKSDLEKIEALYNFTAKRVRYISLLSFGIGGSDPRSASETFQKGYGDCKDKTALLEALLEAKGLRASSVLISADRRVDPDFPTPWPFDHVIAVLRVGSEEVWMDPSSAVLPFRMLAYALRGKQALLMSSDGAPHLEKTPVEAPVPNTWSEEIEGKVENNGTLEATVKITARGDAELPLRQDLLSPAASTVAWAIRGAVTGIEPNDSISDVRKSDPTATNEPFILSFHLSKPIFIRISEKQPSIKLPLSDCRLDLLGGYPTRSENGELLPSRLGPPRQCHYEIKIGFAQTFKIDPPNPITLQSDFASYASSYTSSEGNVLIANRTLAVFRDEVPPSLAEVHTTFRQQMMRDEDSSITVVVADSDAPR